MLPSVDTSSQDVLGGLHVHEFLFALGRGDFVFAELVAVLAGEIALVGDVHHHGLEREMFRERFGFFREGDGGVADGADLRKFIDAAEDIEFVAEHLEDWMS